MALISVLVPVYNIEQFIEKCILSICEQTFADIEIVVIDDGSTDKSGEICKRLAKKDNRIRYFFQRNRGLVLARKKGLVNSVGDYVVFVDGDDFIDSDHIEKLYGLIESEKVDFVHTNYSIDGVNQLFFKSEYLYKDGLDCSERMKIVKNHIFEWRPERNPFECQVYGSIYKTKFICECYANVPDNQSYGEDLICILHAIMNCKSCLFNPYSGYNYTIRNGSFDHPLSFEKAQKDKISLYEEIQRLADQYDWEIEVRKKLKLFFRQKLFNDLFLLNDEYTRVERRYSCGYIQRLRGKSIVLYGAGVVGKDYYNQFLQYSDIKIVAWVDKNHSIIKDTSVNVLSLDSVLNREFDYIVIAVSDNGISNEIETRLIEKGINRETILWKHPESGYYISVL